MAVPFATTLTRQDWGAALPREERREVAADEWKKVEVHHPVYPTIADARRQTFAGVLRNIQRGHQEGQGWNDIFYHVAINYDGETAILRESDGDTLRVLVIGNFEIEEPTDAQMVALREILDAVDGEPFTWHRERAAGTRYASLCPGENMIERLLDIRQGEDIVAKPDANRFINQLYTEILGRSIDPEGKEFWVDQLESGAKTFIEVLTDFLAVSAAADRRAMVALTTRLDARVNTSFGITYEQARRLFLDELVAFQRAVLAAAKESAES